MTIDNLMAMASMIPALVLGGKLAQAALVETLVGARALDVLNLTAGDAPAGTVHAPKMLHEM